MGAGESSEGRELGSDGLAMALMDLKRRKASCLLTEAQYDAGEPKRIRISEQFVNNLSVPAIARADAVSVCLKVSQRVRVTIMSEHVTALHVCDDVRTVVRPLILVPLRTMHDFRYFTKQR